MEKPQSFNVYEILEAIFLQVEQLHKIFKLCGSPPENYWKKLQLPHSTGFKTAQPYRRCVGEMLKDFPSSVVALVDKLLSVDPAHRGTAAAALKSEVLQPFHGIIRELL